MRVVSAVATAILLSAAVLPAQAPITPGLPPPQAVPPAPSAPAPGQEAQAPGVQPPTTTTPAPGTPAVAAPPLTRNFITPAGLLFNTVRPERVADFEAVLWYLQQALQMSTDPTVRAQAQGWKMFRATEPGPNGTVLYVFSLDPAVPKADYGLGRILADAYPDRVQEIWRLYQGAVTSGGNLLNLTPVEPKEPMPFAPAATPRPTAGR
jgi:hypothetical protein